MNKKQLQKQIDCLTSKLAILTYDFNEYKIDIKTRDYLIKTNFLGNIKNESQIGKIIYGTYFDSEMNAYYFDTVCEQIKNYDFKCIKSLLAKISMFEREQQEITGNKEQPVVTKKYTKKNTESHIIENRKTKRGLKRTALTHYALQNKNTYFIENIDDFYKNSYKIPLSYRYSKNDIITLINICYREKTYNKALKELGCANSTFHKYFANLTILNIAKKDKNGKIIFNQDLIIKPFYNNY